MIRKWLPRSIALELTRCQRYFEKTFDQTTVPGTVTSVGVCFATANAAISNGRSYMGSRFSTQKRTDPTMTIYSPITGTKGVVATVTGADVAANSGATTRVGEAEFEMLNSSAGVITPGSGGFAYHWTADAEL